MNLKIKKCMLAFTLVVAILLGQEPLFAQSILSQEVLNNYSIIKDLSYGSDQEQNMDIYLSKEVNNLTEKYTIVFLHGGGYYVSDKTKEERYIAPYLAKGYNVVNLNYRLKRGIPIATEDLTIALNFLKDTNDDYNLNLKRIVVTGFSAGAHIATNVGVSQNNKEYPIKLNKAIKIIGIINFSGPVDSLDVVEKVFVDHEMEIMQTVGKALFPNSDPYASKELITVYEPLTYLDKKDPPVFVWYAGKDDQVPPKTFKNFVARLNANPEKNMVILDPEAGHSPTDASLKETYQMVFYFIDRL